MREYGKVFCAVWESETFRALTDDGKLLAIYLMTCSHSTITGVFRLPDGYVAEDMAWTVSRIQAAFEDLAANGFARRCGATRWVWVIKHLEWNAPENPNQRKAAAKVARGVPKGCGWWDEFLRACGPALGLLGDDEPPKANGSGGGVPPSPAPNVSSPSGGAELAPATRANEAGTVGVTVPGYPQAEPFRNGSETVPERFPKAVANQEQKQEQKQEQYIEDYTERRVSVDNFPEPGPYGAAWAVLHGLGIVGASPGDPVFRAMVDKGVTVDEWRAAAEVALRQGHSGVAYVVGVVKKRRKEAANVAAGLPAVVAAVAPGAAVIVVPPAETAAEYSLRMAAERAAAELTPAQKAKNEAACRAAMERLGRAPKAMAESAS